MREYNAQEDVKQQLVVKRDLIQQSIAQHGSNLQRQEQLRAVQNEITQATIAQSQAVKSMRDGWVSAISAMNTGMGGFSEIIMDAESNTAQVMQLKGAVRSQMSGAIAQRDAFGRITERGVGRQGSSRMTARGSFAGQDTMRAAYQTDFDKRTGINPGELLKGIRTGNIAPLVEGMNRAGRGATSGGLQALGVGANKINTGIAAAGGLGAGLVSRSSGISPRTYSSSNSQPYSPASTSAGTNVVVNINLNPEDIRGIGREVERRIFATLGPILESARNV